MTSSQKSIFDFGKRRALFVSAHKLAVYHWYKGDLASSYLFDVNNDGKLYFERYLRETPNVPAYMLIDVFEEEFKRDTAPHVYGADRASVIERKKARLFRETPYYFYKVQGREEEGRKDDQIMLSAITNPKLITPWIELLDKYKVPLAGIYSVPLMTESLVKLLPETGGNNLVVSIQSISGLRQSFIQNNQLRVSRLVQLPRYGTEPYGPHIKEEVDKIKRYLNSVRLVPSPSDTPQGSALNTFFLLSSDVLDDLRGEYKDSSTAGMHFLDINELLAQSGSARQVSSPFSDQLFVHQLLKQKPSNYYARPREKRYNVMRNMRLSMFAASAVLMVASVLWSGYTFIQGLDLRQGTLSAQSKTGFYNTRYQIAREGLPDTPVEANELKIAVDLVEKLDRYRTTPYEMIRLVSIAMNRFSDIRLDGFQWVSGADPNIKVGAGPGAGNNQGVIGYSNVAADNDYDYYQVAVIDAEVKPFDGNYRGAISLINAYAETLRNLTDVYDVSILSLPLDVSSEANMQGNTNNVQREAKFSIRVVMGIKHEV